MGDTDRIERDLYAMEKEIRRDPSISGKEKARLIKEINDERNECAKDFYETRKEAGF